MWLLRLRRFLKTAGRDALLLLFALRDPDTPRAVKAMTVLLLLYAISPLDIVPDVILLLGWTDDLALLLLGVPYLARRLPPAVHARASLKVEALRARFGSRRA